MVASPRPDTTCRVKRSRRPVADDPHCGHRVFSRSTGFHPLRHLSIFHGAIAFCSPKKRRWRRMRRNLNCRPITRCRDRPNPDEVDGSCSTGVGCDMVQLQSVAWRGAAQWELRPSASIWLSMSFKFTVYRRLGAGSSRLGHGHVLALSSRIAVPDRGQARGPLVGGSPSPTPRRERCGFVADVGVPCIAILPANLSGCGSRTTFTGSVVREAWPNVVWPRDIVVIFDFPVRRLCFSLRRGCGISFSE